MDLDTVWDNITAALGDASRELLGFAVAAVEALALLIAASFVARRLRARTRHALLRSGLGPNIAALVANGVGIGVYVLAATFVLGLFGADWTALLTVFSVGTLAISLAMQDVLKNFIAGVYILLERPFSIGDRVRIREIEGQVEGIEIRTTMLRNEADERVLVPNATVFAEIVTNRSVHKLSHTIVTLKGLVAPLDTLPATITEALAGLNHVRDASPRTTVTAVGADGADLTIDVPHAAGTDVAPLLLARLRDRFPDATIAIDARP